jgi:ribonuclease HI
MKSETFILEFDGGSRGNPGPAGVGVVVRAGDGTPVVTLGRCIGRATNNVAEYTALITAMKEALKLGARNVIIRGDSELIVRQMRGEYRVKHPDMKELYEQAQEVLREFDSARIEHNLRNKNELADKLLNLALDRKCDVTEVNSEPNSPLDEPSAKPTRAGDRFVCRRCGCAIEVKKPSSIRPHQLKPFACQCGNKMEGL